MTFYAKPDQTYKEHAEAVYTAWKETISAKRPLIERMAEKYNFSAERFLKGSLLTIAFHDIGKMIEPFQEMMWAIIHNKSFDKKKTIAMNWSHFHFQQNTGAL
jgi:CRISPR-associated endonuclease/helicase Cas3